MTTCEHGFAIGIPVYNEEEIPNSVSCTRNKGGSWRGRSPRRMRIRRTGGCAEKRSQHVDEYQVHLRTGSTEWSESSILSLYSVSFRMNA